MPEKATLSEHDLHAYADGQLSPAEARDVAEHLAQDAEAAARVAAWQQQSRDLRSALDPMLDEPVPARLSIRPVAARTRAWGWPLAAVATLIVGVAVGWIARAMLPAGPSGTEAFARQSAMVHRVFAPDVNRSVEIAGAEEKLLVRWLSRRLGAPVKAPDLNGVGYSLVGGRLLAGDEGPVALFVYQAGDGRRLTLNVKREPGSGQPETAFRYAFDEGIGVFYWIDRGFGYALSGELDRARLLTVARTVYGQLATMEPSAETK